MIDVRRLHSTLVQLTGNSDVYVRVDGVLYPVEACQADRSGGAIVSRRLILDVVIPESAEEGGEGEEANIPATKRRGRPPKVVA